MKEPEEEVIEENEYEFKSAKAVVEYWNLMGETDKIIKMLNAVYRALGDLMSSANFSSIADVIIDELRLCDKEEVRKIWHEFNKEEV